MSTELPTPECLDLGEVIHTLKNHDPDTTLRLGFHRPHSYRGDYMDLAFEIAENVTVGAMLADARSAVGATFEGWKGGDYTMDKNDPVWLVQERGDTGETLGRVLLGLMLTNVAPNPEDAKDRGVADNLIPAPTKET